MTPQYEQIDFVVPTGHVNCCPCPDHSTNYVGVAYKSSRLRLVDSNGLDFSRSGTSCTVNLAGVYPSSEVGDATLAFARNGEVYRQYDKTVLGVSVKGAATSVRPPLLVDYNRDGRIDFLDVADYLAGRLAYFWMNDDTWRYDDAFDAL